MLDWIKLLVDGSGFPPRWHCGNWSEGLGWLHIVSDVVVFLCYMAIPALLLWFRSKRRDIPFPRLFSLFALFILSCGVSHLVEAVIFWEPVYRLAGLLKLTTAGVSLVTVSYLVPAVPKLFALRSPADLEAEVIQRRAAEEELRALHLTLEQKVVERTGELLLARERLELALYAGEMGIWEADLETGKVTLDSRATRTFDLPDRRVDWSELLARLSPADQQKLVGAANSALRDAQPRAAVTLRIEQEDKPVRTVETRVTSMREVGQQRVLAVSWDASEGRAAAALQSRLSEILEATPDFVATATLDGTIIWQNAALRNWLGLPKKPGHAVPAPVAKQLLGTNVSTAVAKGSWLGEAVVVHNGQRRDVSQLLVAHQDLDQEVTHVSAILRDLSAIKSREQLLRESEQRLHAAIDAAPSAMGMIDADGKIRLHNAEFERLFGYSAEELSNLTVDSLVAPEARQRHRADRKRYGANPTRRAMDGGRPLFGLHKSGRPVPLEIGLNPLRLAGERFTLISVLDISQRLHASKVIEDSERRLREVNQGLREFAYAASHDLQEPLRKVIGFCQLLELELGENPPPKAVEYVGLAVDGAKRMRILIRDLLEYSSLHQSSLTTETVSTQQCVQHAQDVLSEKILECGARIVEGPLPDVLGSKMLLQRVFSNLLGNALKYRSLTEKPVVEVGATPDGDEMRFYVRDNGIGISAENRERVFRVFQRLHGSSEYPGTGVGLAIVKKSIEHCGGKIWIEANSPAGTIVYFTLKSPPPS